MSVDKLTEEIAVYAPSGKLVQMKHKELATIPLPNSTPELVDYMDHVGRVQSSTALLSYWLLGRCAEHHCSELKGLQDIEEASITQALNELASELGLKLRTMQNYRRFFREYPDIEIVSILAQAGVSWTNFLEIIFPIPLDFVNEFITYLLEYIEEQGICPSVSAMRDKAEEILEAHAIDESSEDSDPQKDPDVELSQIGLALQALDKTNKELDKLIKKCQSLDEDTHAAISTLWDEPLADSDRKTLEEFLEIYETSWSALATSATNQSVTYSHLTSHRQSMIKLVSTVLQLAQMCRINIKVSEDADGRQIINIIPVDSQAG